MLRVGDVPVQVKVPAAEKAAAAEQACCGSVGSGIGLRRVESNSADWDVDQKLRIPPCPPAKGGSSYFVMIPRAPPAQSGYLDLPKKVREELSSKKKIVGSPGVRQTGSSTTKTHP